MTSLSNSTQSNLLCKHTDCGAICNFFFLLKRGAYLVPVFKLIFILKNADLYYPHDENCLAIIIGLIFIFVQAWSNICMLITMAFIQSCISYAPLKTEVWQVLSLLLCLSKYSTYLLVPCLFFRLLQECSSLDPTMMTFGGRLDSLASSTAEKKSEFPAQCFCFFLFFLPFLTKNSSYLRFETWMGISVCIILHNSPNWELVVFMSIHSYSHFVLHSGLQGFAGESPK